MHQAHEVTAPADDDRPTDQDDARAWAAPVVQTLRLTSGPSTLRSEPPATTDHRG